jgi:hypothetical protein
VIEHKISAQGKMQMTARSPDDWQRGDLKNGNLASLSLRP